MVMGIWSSFFSALTDSFLLYHPDLTWYLRMRRIQNAEPPQLIPLYRNLEDFLVNISLIFLQKNS